jgi:hypothetical protein
MLVTDGLLRAQLRAEARAAVEPQSWEHVIASFEAELESVAAESDGEPASVPA